MGDFNDEPFRPLTGHPRAQHRQRIKVVNTDTMPGLWNLMWPATGGPQGTFYFDNQPNVLDQVVVSKNMARDT